MRFTYNSLAPSDAITGSRIYESCHDKAYLGLSDEIIAKIGSAGSVFGN